ncbi:MAG: cellulose biosynthesis cyclic di-GMP-binding regulatory protein BcsB, partial [Burkholderiaceae bacterium]|nr:cellulose biosynthesis cyclic di-GMP-binding regulatory protein BcsB [Burkholderiaceae bacterium]
VSAARPRADLPRRAYDAPNWVRLDRPMKFGELVDNAQQLQAFGHMPAPIRIGLRIPPDLFTWRSRGVPVDLKFRYTAPIRASESRLAMSINDELVQAFNLRASGQGGDSARVLLPLLDDSLLGEGREVLIPAFKLGSRNQLQYAFSFTYQKDGACRDTQVENVRAMIDADSKIDFSGYPHYAQMPHLGYFATAGFPFTKYADLAQTTVVLPDAPGAQDIEVMLTLLGRMGESTGYPATRVEIGGARDETLLRQRDLLLIGAAPQQALLERWGDKLPALIAGQERKISRPARGATFLYDWFGFGSQPDLSVAVQSNIQGGGAMAALLGFESPLSGERSVVALTAVTPAGMLQALDALDNDKLVRSMHGSAVFIAPERVESVQAGATYTIGSLPFYSAIWYPLSEHPLLLALLGLLAVLVFAFALWRSLKALAAARLKDRP